jgi:hypothetical protein
MASTRRVVPAPEPEVEAEPAQDEEDQNESNNNEDLFSNNEDEEDAAHDQGNNLDANIRNNTIAMFQRVLTFREGAATALFNYQQITDFDSLRKLDNDTIKELCRSITKEGHPISVIAQNRLKLLVFWVKHMWRTCRGVDDLTNNNHEEDIKPLRDQKAL